MKVGERVWESMIREREQTWMQCSLYVGDIVLIANSLENAKRDYENLIAKNKCKPNKHYYKVTVLQKSHQIIYFLYLTHLLCRVSLKSCESGI